MEGGKLGEIWKQATPSTPTPICTGLHLKYTIYGFDQCTFKYKRTLKPLHQHILFFWKPDYKGNGTWILSGHPLLLDRRNKK